MHIITGSFPDSEPLYSRYLATACVTRPDLMAEVDRIIDAPAEWSRPNPCFREADCLRVADNKRLAMQWFEDQVAPADVHFGEDTYERASVLLRCRRIREEGSPAFRTGPLPLDVGRVSPGRLKELAGLLHWWSDFAGDLEIAGRRWATLLAGRPRTAPEEHFERQVTSGQVRPFGQPVPGIDGARYTLAVCHDRGGARRAGTVVTHHGGGSELVRFASMPTARAWLTARTAGSGPLVTATDPGCRVAREEQVLAWLMHNAPDTAMHPVLRQITWTSHLRRMVFDYFPRKWSHSYGPGQWQPFSRNRSDFRERLVWTPREYAGMIGWPDRQRAMAYWDRLQATPVPVGQAVRAAWALASEDMAAARAAEAARAAAPVTAPARERATLPGGRRWAVTRRQSGIQDRQALLSRPLRPEPGYGPRPRI